MTTVLDRLTAAGISEDSARAALAAGRVHVEGVRVVDPDAPIAEDASVIEKLD